MTCYQIPKSRQKMRIRNTALNFLKLQYRYIFCVSEEGGGCIYQNPISVDTIAKICTHKNLPFFVQSKVLAMFWLARFPSCMFSGFVSRLRGSAKKNIFLVLTSAMFWSWSKLSVSLKEMFSARPLPSL